MTKLSAGKASVHFLTAVSVVTLLGYSLNSVYAQAAASRVYCHANSGASGYVYHNNPAWNSHFENNGSPKAGHELDFYTIEGDVNCEGLLPTTPPVSPSVTPTPSPEPTLPATPPVSPSVTPTPEQGEGPSVTPTPSPVPDVLGTSDDVCTNLDGVQTSVPTGWFQNGAGSTECRQFQFGGAPTNETGAQGQVLGASTGGSVLGSSTLASTGNTENYLMMLGLILSATSAYGLLIPTLSKKSK